MGFAPPPRGGFAVVAAPERQSARDGSYQLGAGRYICRMAIYLEPGGATLCQVVIPCTRTSENAGRANFLELRNAEVHARVNFRIAAPRCPKSSPASRVRTREGDDHIGLSGPEPQKCTPRWRQVLENPKNPVRLQRGSRGL